MAPGAQHSGQVEAVRRFNRYYTGQIGVLREGLLDSPYTLTEARVIYELAQQAGVTASELGGQLGLDAGYLSRLLGVLTKQGLVARERSEVDGRRSHLRLTPDGEAAFAALNSRSREEIGALLDNLPGGERKRLVGAMAAIEDVLSAPAERREPFILRPHQPGDIGWVVSRHGALYAEEYGWDGTFEALVARVAAEFVETFDPAHERCWIAEVDGMPVGSVFLVRKSKTVAKLRLLIVDPAARGLGLGRRLVEECIRFARRTGYRKITLWTNDVLHAARHIYEVQGFVLVAEEPHHSFGADLVGQTWELDLRR